MSDIIPQKRCPRCTQLKTATPEFFSRNKRAKDGLQVYCKRCASEKQIERRQAPPKPPIPEGYKRCTKCGTVLPGTNEYFYPQWDCKYGVMAICKQCYRVKQNQRRQDNYERFRLYDLSRREIHRQHTANYRKAHREIIRAKGRQYYSSHVEAYKIRHIRYVADPEKREERRLYNLRYDQGHKEERRLYRRRNSVRRKGNEHKRRAWKNGNGGTYTVTEVQNLYKRQKGRCYYCRKKLMKPYHVDHIVPLSRGGSNDISNIVIACGPCNCSKGNKLLHEWVRGGRLL